MIEWVLVAIAVIEVIWLVALGILQIRMGRETPCVDIECRMTDFDCNHKGEPSNRKPTRHCVSDIRLANNGTRDARHIIARYYAVVEGVMMYNGLATKRGQRIHLAAGKATTIRNVMSFSSNDHKSFIKRLYWVVNYRDSKEREYISFAVFALNPDVGEWVVDEESFTVRAKDKKAIRSFYYALESDIIESYAMEDFIPI